MKTKAPSRTPLTFETLRKIFATKQDLFETKIKITEELKEEIKKRNDVVLTRLDDIVGQLEGLREDRDLAIYQSRELKEKADDHEQRIKKLEKTSHLA